MDNEIRGRPIITSMLLDRIGGRIYATDIKCATGIDRWDLGGQWVGEYVFVPLYYLMCTQSSTLAIRSTKSSTLS